MTVPTVPTDPSVPCLARKTVEGKNWTCRLPRHTDSADHVFTADEPSVVAGGTCGAVEFDARGHEWYCLAAPHGRTPLGNAGHYFVRKPEPDDDHRQQLTKLEITKRPNEPTFVNIEFDGAPAVRGYLTPRPEDVTFTIGSSPIYRIDGDLFKIEPTSCRCGGSFAWLKQRPSGMWEMVGCICHHLPTGAAVLVSQLNQ